MDEYGRRPAASWVIGRSARWHGPAGRELLAEDAAAEDLRRDLATLRGVAIPTATGVGLSTAIDVLLWLGQIAGRIFRRRAE